MNTALHEVPATRITNRPIITLASQPCPNCGAPYFAAWGWLFLPDGRVLDLCGQCSRLLRYGTAEAQRALLATIWTRYGVERRLAA